MQGIFRYNQTPIFFLRQEKATFGFRVDQAWVNVMYLRSFCGHSLYTSDSIQWQDDIKT